MTSMPRAEREPGPTLRWSCFAILALGLGMTLLSSCRQKLEAAPPVGTSDIVVQAETTPAAPFGVDFCLDATPSMEGFAADSSSSYQKLLGDLDGTLTLGVKNVKDVRYFKFGETIRQIPRERFLDAKSHAFYHEPGILRETNIELILQTDRGSPAKGAGAGPGPAPAPHADSLPRVTVAITDLFQKDQDVNAVVQQIRDGCLRRPDCSVGILAIPSAFDGVVYDARVPSYRYRSTPVTSTFRPFYLLMFGPEEQLLQLADILSAQPYIDLSRFLVIGPRIVSSYGVATEQVKGTKGLVKRKTGVTAYSSLFNLQAGFTEGRLISTITVKLHPNAFSFNPARVKLRSFRQQSARTIPADSEVEAESITGTSGAMKLSLKIRPPEPKGDYVYVGELLVGTVNGFLIPEWVAQLSSPNPTSDHDPAKTLNLDRLVERLVAASVLQDHHRPTLARFRITLHRL